MDLPLNLREGNRIQIFRTVVLQVDSDQNLQTAKTLNNLLGSSEQHFEMVVVVPPSFPKINNKDNPKGGKKGGGHAELDLIYGDFVNTRFLFLSGSEISLTSALWAGIDSAIGDRVSVIFAMPENLDDLSSFWSDASKHDAFFGYPPHKKTGRSATQRALGYFLGRVYKLSTGRDLENRPIGIADLSRQYVNFLHRTGQPEISLRNSNIYTGFHSGHQTLSALTSIPRKRTSDLFGRGMEILFSASSLPLRAVSVLAITGAGLNLVYSVYVLLTSLTSSVSEGWTSMSLQISGMFFLTSLVLAMICEFLIYSRQSNSPSAKYFIAREISSPRSGLNIELNIAEMNNER